MTVGHLLREISSREITGWMAFLAVEDELEKSKKSKESRVALQAHIEQLGRAAEKKKKKMAMEKKNKIQN